MRWICRRLMDCATMRMTNGSLSKPGTTKLPEHQNRDKLTYAQDNGTCTLSGTQNMLKMHQFLCRVRHACTRERDFPLRRFDHHRHDCNRVQDRKRGSIRILALSLVDEDWREMLLYMRSSIDKSAEIVAMSLRCRAGVSHLYSLDLV